MAEVEAVEAVPVEEESALAVQYSPASITANFDALEAHVRRLTEGYAEARYDLTSSEDIRQAKRDRTYLNGIAKEIDERRKAVKREYTRPLDAFTARCNEIVGIAKEASGNIKAQLDEAEAERRKNAYARLKEHYEEFAGLLAPVVPYERLHDEKWLNKTYGEVKACEALEEKVSKLAEDWDTLKAQLEGQPFYAEAERELFATLDLGAALTAARRAADESARIAELKAAVEPEPAPAPEAYAPPEPTAYEAKVAENETRVKAEAEALGAPCVPPAPVPEAAPCVMVIDSATVEQMQAIGRFAGSIGVTGVFKRGTLQQVYERTIR